MLALLSSPDVLTPSSRSLLFFVSSGLFPESALVSSVFEAELLLLFAAGAFYGMLKGKASTLFYPVCVVPGFDVVTALSMISFAAMLLTPAVMDMYGEVRWRRAGQNV